MSPRAAWRLETLGFRDVRDYAAGKLDWLAFGLPAEGHTAPIPKLAGAMRSDAPSCLLTDTVEVAKERLAGGDWSWCAVLNPTGILMGRLRRGAAEEAPEGALAVEIMEEGPSTYRPSVPCGELMERMKKGRFDLAFVTDPEGRWLGLVSRQATQEQLDRHPVPKALE